MDMKMFILPFKGLKEGVHHFEFKIDKTFFEVYKNEDIKDVDVKASIKLLKKSTLLDLHFNFDGKVEVVCDLTNELFDQPIKTELDIIVKFGEIDTHENENILTLPFEANEVKVDHYMYEAIVLALPIKKIHPGVLDGTLKSDLLDKLKELQPRENLKNDLDPRWDKLKELLTDKKI